MSTSTRVLITLLIAVAAAHGQVTPVTPAAFSGTATVETFEGILGTPAVPQSMLIGMTVPWGMLPYNFTLPGGATVSGPPAPDSVEVYDFSVPAGLMGGWGLGIGVGDLNASTALPSGTSCCAVNNFSAGGDLEITFTNPVTRVGAWVETPTGTAVLQAFDFAGAPIGTVTAPTDGLLDNALDSWIGLASSVPIGRVVFQIGFGLIDDLTFEAGGPTIGWTQSGPGAPVFINNTGLVPGNQYYNLFSLDLCPGGPGTGPAATFGGCISTPANLLFINTQLMFPLGTAPYHVIAPSSNPTWGPFPGLPPITVDAICIDITNGLANAVASPVTRVNIL